MRARWADWAIFEPAARKYLSNFHRLHHRSPRYRELLAGNGHWFIHASKKYHGGFRHVMARLGFRLAARERPVTRRSNWETFSADAGPIIATYVKRLRRPPTQPELRDDGLHWLVSASNMHHGGLLTVYERLGYNVEHRKSHALWKPFSRAALPILQQLQLQLGHVPLGQEVKAAGYSWIFNASYQHHGGFRQVLRRLGFKPTVQRSLSGRGLANWSELERQFKPVLQQFVNQHGRPPFLSELVKLGYKNLYFAARNHHSGYLVSLRRMGFEPDVRQCHNKPQGWSYLPRRRQTIAQNFPEFVRLGIMPSSGMVKRKCPGLCAYWTWRRRKWSLIAAELNLEPYRTGEPMIAHVQAVTEALTFFESHRRWPMWREMSSRLRYFRQQSSWLQFFNQTSLTKPLLELLAQRWIEHVEWCRRNHPHALRLHMKQMNRIIISRNYLVPPSPPSS